MLVLLFSIESLPYFLIFSKRFIEAGREGLGAKGAAAQMIRR